MKNNTVNYEERILAFIDILGFKSMIAESEKNVNRIKKIHRALEFLKNQEKNEEWSTELVEIEESAQYKGVENFIISDKISCMCFSDSIIVSVLAKDKINEYVSTLITRISLIGAKLMTEGILLRGVITIGKLLHSDGIIMGQALIDAYELEKNIAGDARIIISQKLLGKMNYPIREKRYCYPYNEYLTRFDDGCVGFHQMIYYQVLQSWENMDKDKMRDELEKIRQVIIQGLDSFFQDPQIFRKYYWLLNQYNNLVILEDNIKNEIIELNKGISRSNIHYSLTDEFYYKNKQISHPHLIQKTKQPQ